MTVQAPKYNVTQELIFLVGLPASGKTTWAKEKVKKNLTYVRISRDDLRHMRGQYWVPDDEYMITKWEISAIATALASGKNVIVDATNLYQDRRIYKLNQIIEYLKWMRKGETSFHAVDEKSFLNVPIDICIKRDKERLNGVGEKVIRGMTTNPASDAYIPSVEYKHQEGLPYCIIVDIDGTLSDNTTGRGFYDWKRVGEDIIVPEIKHIIDLYNQVQGNYTILMTGRDGICRDETVKWLAVNNVDYDMILMRAQGDMRKDSVVKRELYDKWVKDIFNVRFVLDDRDQVVNMWRRDLGIKCLQVNYGDF